MTVRINLIDGYTIKPIYKNLIDSITEPRDSLKYNYALYDIIKNSGAKCVIEGLDVWAEFEEEKNLTMFILRWS